jgi:phage tail-like protein
MTASDTGATSGYLAYLPAIFRADPFAGRFLLAFETILSGTDLQRPGLEAKIGRLAGYLDPMTTDEEFLPWLASWVALSLRADWDPGTKRRFIAQITSLYRLRGTPEGLRRMLKLYTDAPVEVVDDFAEPAYYFQVQLTLPEADPDLLRERNRSLAPSSTRRSRRTPSTCSAWRCRRCG